MKATVIEDLTETPRWRETVVEIDGIRKTVNDCSKEEIQAVADAYRAGAGQQDDQPDHYEERAVYLGALDDSDG